MKDVFIFAAGMAVCVWLVMDQDVRSTRSFEAGFAAGQKHALTPMEQESRCLDLWAGRTYQQQQLEEGMTDGQKQ